MDDPEDSWPEDDPRNDYMPVIQQIEESVATTRVYTMVTLIVLIFFVVAVILLAGYLLVFRFPPAT